MKAKWNKFIPLFLIFYLLTLSGNLYTKERRGVELVVQKKDGKQETGELIAVKQNSLLLLDSEGLDVSVNIGEIRVIKIVKKSKSLVLGGIGLVSGAAIGALIGYLLGDDPPFMVTGFGPIMTGPPLMTADEKALALGSICGIAGGALGGIGGAIAGVDKIIQIEGKSETEIEKVLNRLRKKARVPYYQ